MIISLCQFIDLEDGNFYCLVNHGKRELGKGSFILAAYVVVAFSYLGTTLPQLEAPKASYTPLWKCSLHSQLPAPEDLSLPKERACLPCTQCIPSIEHLVAVQ